MKNRRKIPGRALLGAVVQLSALPVDDGAKGAWNVLAYEVDMASGVKLTAADFEACVANFARYPKVPLVIEHADTDLFGKAEWAAPHGWIAALRVGTYTRPNGVVVASLEGMIQADAATRPAINGDAANPPTWPFGSVTVFRGTDEETGADVGMCLWSFSLTSHPRLVDVPRLAASARTPRAATEAGYYWGSIDDRDDLVEALRQVFDLPALAPEADAVGQLDKLETMLDAGSGEAQGVDLDHLVCQLREALRLPALSTAAEVIAAVRKGLALPAEGATETMSRGAAARTTHGDPMKTFLEMAAKFGLAAANEDDAREKVLAHVQAAGELYAALGARTPAEAASALTTLQKDAAKVVELTTANKTLADAIDTHQKAARAAHIGDVMAAEFADLPKDRAESMRRTLEIHAKADWEGFQKEHPRPARAELAQRAQDPQRLARVAGKGRAAPSADTGAEAGPTTADLMAGATQMVTAARARGESLSLSEAYDLLGAELADDASQEDAAPADRAPPREPADG